MFKPVASAISPDVEFEAAVAEAFDRVMGHHPPAARAEALGRLRQELDRCLAHAPITENPVAAVALRARLAAAIGLES